MALAGCIAVSGLPEPAAAAVEPVNPVTVLLDGHPANSGFTVFVREDVNLSADEAEGTIALGGDLSFGTTYSVAAAPTPTFTVPGETNQVSLYVGGGVDWASSAPGARLRVQNQGFTKIADTDTFAAFNKNPNDYQITAPGGAIDQTPLIEGTVGQSPASIGAPVPADLIDIEGAFGLYEQLSTDLATCPTTVVLTDDAGNPIGSPPVAPFRAHVTLTSGQTNVLNISADDLARLQELTFDDVPTQDTPLLVNVTGDFSGNIPNQPGLTAAAARYILYNFADAATVSVTGGDSLHGTVYAPRAFVNWRVTQNLEGNLIADSVTHGVPVAPVGLPRQLRNLPFDALLSCSDAVPDDPTLTLVKVVEGGPAAATDWTLSAVSGDTVVEGVSGSPEVTGVVTPAGEYVLSEAGEPADYVPGDWVCTGAAQAADVVTLAEGDDAVCTITNVYSPPVPDDPTLTLVKVVEGGPAAATDWTLSAVSGDTVVAGVSGSAEVTGVVTPAGEYVLSEAGEPADYVPGDWVCTGARAGRRHRDARRGDDAVCTITNVYSPPVPDDPTLTLVKVVDGGDAVATDWTLSAVSGDTVVAGVSGSPEVTGVVTPAGEYVLSESGAPLDYVPGGWACTGATAQAGDVVTLADGDDAVCTITNVYSMPVPPDPTDPPVPPTPPVPPAPPAGGSLPQTGSDFPLLAVSLIGLGLIVSGALVRTTRHRVTARPD